MLFASLAYFKLSKFINYKGLLTIAVFIGIAIPILALLLSNSQFYFQFIFILSGIFVSIFKMSNSGILLEISTNDNRAIYAGISGAGKIFTMIFPLIAGVLIYYIGFTAVFIFVSATIVVSYFFVRKLNC
jgi:MFS family permease